MFAAAAIAALVFIAGWYVGNRTVEQSPTSQMTDLQALCAVQRSFDQRPLERAALGHAAANGADLQRLAAISSIGSISDDATVREASSQLAFHATRYEWPEVVRLLEEIVRRAC